VNFIASGLGVVEGEALAIAFMVGGGCWSGPERAVEPWP
jgi:hypothetical protein